jgi:hypothetical protein
MVLETTGSFGSLVLAGDLVSGSGEKEGKEVREGSWSRGEEAEALEPARLGAPRTVWTLLLSDEAREVWDEERLDKLLPLSDMVKGLEVPVWLGSCGKVHQPTILLDHIERSWWTLAVSV